MSGTKRDVLEEGLDDHVALWAVAFHARGDRNEALGALSGLLEEGLAVAGTPKPGGGFEAFGEAPEETARRAELEWDGLGHAPDVGESDVWLELTDKGRERAPA